jgi:hypothetical protein
MGRGARTHHIDIPAPRVLGARVANDGEVVYLQASVDCWVDIGPAAEAAPLTTWLILAGDSLELQLMAGDRIAVIAA